MRAGPPTSMRPFVTIWAGQTVSRFGTYMTAFALYELWLWEQTGRASALAVVGVTSILGGLAAGIFGGPLVDRFSRKRIMIAADLLAAVGTLLFLLLLLADQLAIWHLYAGSMIIAFFNELHGLAFISSTTLLVPRDQYARAGSMRFLTYYGAVIFAGPLAAGLYEQVGLISILVVDLLTVSAAIFTVLRVDVPEPPVTAAGLESRSSRLGEILYGFRYIRRSPSLRTFLLLMALFTFAHDGGESIYGPLVLSRTGNDFALFGSLLTAAGLGGLTGAIVMATWGSRRLTRHRRINGWIAGTLGAGLAKLTFSFGRGGAVWLPAQFCSSINFPVRGGSKEAILLARIEPDIQGRYFGAEQITLYTMSIASRSLTLLADDVLEPAMQPGGALAEVLGGVYGTGPGSGYALLYTCTSISIVLVALMALMLPALREIETRLEDHSPAQMDETIPAI